MKEVHAESWEEYTDRLTREQLKSNIFTNQYEFEAQFRKNQQNRMEAFYGGKEENPFTKTIEQPKWNYLTQRWEFGPHWNKDSKKWQYWPPHNEMLDQLYKQMYPQTQLDGMT